VLPGDGLKSRILEGYLGLLVAQELLTIMQRERLAKIRAGG
jgi:hypothetical protein